MEQEKELTDALNAIDQAITPSVDEVSAQGIGDLCQKYNELKPKIETVIGIVEKIPLPQIRQLAKLIRTLMSICDTACALAP